MVESSESQSLTTGVMRRPGHRILLRRKGGNLGLRRGVREDHKLLCRMMSRGRRLTQSTNDATLRLIVYTDSYKNSRRSFYLIWSRMIDIIMTLGLPG